MDTARGVRITVRGRLSPRLAQAFDGLSVSASSGQTELVGRVEDQAELYGLLARIRDLGLDLTAVVTADPAPTGRKEEEAS